MTVLNEFEFRIVTELLGLTEDLPILLQLLLSASAPTVGYYSPNSNRYYNHLQLGARSIILIGNPKHTQNIRDIPPSVTPDKQVFAEI